MSYQALREIPELECALKETLRLHPPLIILMRKVMEEFRYKDYVIEPGPSPSPSRRRSRTACPSTSPSPSASTPSRYEARTGRRTSSSFAWLPFGAGRHRCVGAAFAMMQLKAIFSVLLRGYDFELAQPTRELPATTTRRWW